MKLKSFGCSFIFGTDLPDDGRNGLYATGSRMTWPALVAGHLGYDYSTHARPGSGNLQILERLLNEIALGDPAVYVIGWSWIDRFDYIDNEKAERWPGSKWQTLMPIDQSPVAESYFRHLNSEYSDKLRSLIYMNTAIDTLKRNDCEFVMTCMDALVFCDRWSTTPTTLDLMERTRPYISSFEGKNFLDWSKARGFAISQSQHPLEQAHAAAAELILRNWSDYIKS